MPREAKPPVRDEDHARRPHLSGLAWGLLDARMSHVNYLDTPGGDEVFRLLELGERLRHPRAAGSSRHLRHRVVS